MLRGVSGKRGVVVAIAVHLSRSDRIIPVTFCEQVSLERIMPDLHSIGRTSLLLGEASSAGQTAASPSRFVKRYFLH